MIITNFTRFLKDGPFKMDNFMILNKVKVLKLTFGRRGTKYERTE